MVPLKLEPTGNNPPPPDYGMASDLCYLVTIHHSSVPISCRHPQKFRNFPTGKLGAIHILIKNGFKFLLIFLFVIGRFFRHLTLNVESLVALDLEINVIEQTLVKHLSTFYIDNQLSHLHSVPNPHSLLHLA